MAENNLRAAPIVLATILTLGAISFAQDDEADIPVVPNLDIMRMLSERISGRVAQTLGRHDSTRILVQVLPREISWLVEGGILRGISAQGLKPIATGNASFDVEFGLSNLSVEYSNIRRDGFFGSKMVDRQITVLTNVKLVDRTSGLILLSNPMEEKYSDSVPVSVLSEIENENLPLTRGKVPGEGFFSSVAEPFIALGAVAVAVLLLFHVRS